MIDKYFQGKKDEATLNMLKQKKAALLGAP